MVHDIASGAMEKVNFPDIPSVDEPLDQNILLNRVIRKSDFIDREGIRAFIGISLRASRIGEDESEEDEVGVLYVNYRSPHHFSSSETNLIQLLGQQVANQIRAARLFEKQQNSVKDADVN